MAHTTQYTTPIAAALGSVAATTSPTTPFPTFKALAAKLRRTRKHRRDPARRLAAAYRLMARHARARGDHKTAATHHACYHALRVARAAAHT